jgi:F0F1-type ATP synthase membrane subunit b/b'
MEMLLGLIDSLKLDNTLFIQFLIFLVGYAILYYVLFKPYNEAARIRHERTKGSEDSADKYDDEIEILKRKYGQKAKETNLAVKEVFTDYETKTKKEVADLLMQAQTKYKSEKEEQEKAVYAHFETEKTKVPNLVKDLKEQLKKVLAGA